MTDEIVQTIAHAQRVTVLTGAGVSAESGVPTFRDVLTGLWARFNPQELATPEAFRRNPKLVWEWYAYRRELVGSVAPNAGHYALAEMERRLPQFTLITQNVDGLHQRAGSKNIVELHGNLSRVRCFREDTIIESWQENGEIPPRCPRCGAYLRPDVVWFGEMLPIAALDQAMHAAQQADVFFSIGTSGVVEPAASLPFEALRRVAVVIEINPDETPLSEAATFRIAEPSGVALPALVERLWGNHSLTTAG